MKLFQRPKANLNRDVKKKILRLHEKGCSLSQIAEQLELKMTHVMDILEENELKPNLSLFEEK